MVHDLLIFFLLFLVAISIRQILKRLLWALPSSFIAGLMGLLLIQLDIIQFYGSLSSYIQFALSIIFITFTLSVKKFNYDFAKTVKPLWKYSILQFVSQWSISLLFVIFCVKLCIPSINDTFAVILPVGFAGGHASAAIVGSILGEYGHKEIFSLAMTVATIGTIFAIFGGMLIISLSSKNKSIIQYENFRDELKQFKSLNLKTIIIILSLISAGFYVTPIIKKIFNIEVPLFFTCIIISLTLRRLIINPFKPEKQTLLTTTNLATDILICISIATIKISIVIDYIYPLLSLILMGVLLCICFFKYLAPLFFKEQSFEKALFTWGWSLGGLVFGLALLKIVTSEKTNLKLLEQISTSYLLMSPIEIILLLTLPYFIFHGYGLVLAIILFLLAFILIKSELNVTDK